MIKILKKSTKSKSGTNSSKKVNKLKTLLKKKVSIKLKKISKVKKTTKKVLPKKKIEKIEEKPKKILKRFVGNPVIHPARDMYWESTATFNPTAFIHDGKIHVIYRAVGVNDMSTLGYVGSMDGYNFSERTFKPIFIHKNYSVDKGEPLFYSSGGGWNGGAEDPRITKIDDMLYMTYTAFNGWGSVRIGFTSISLEDFLNKKWNWKKPVLISPPNEVHKNWVLFPEKINGKFAILHSLSPEILIEYVKDINSFDGTKFIHSIHQDSPKWKLREKGMRGVGGAPIKTKYGWLLFYHGMEPNEMHRYKLWAMILDLKDPTKVLFRSKKPILEPDAFYENEGIKSGIIYSCGAIVKDGELFVYYGGADMVSCVATANLDKFLKDLTSIGITKLGKEKKKK
jgi:predicted GH43/DUF377 family glycosyl hydrolase